MCSKDKNGEQHSDLCRCKSKSTLSNEALQVFLHHIEEFQKGLRNLVLHTTSIDSRSAIERVLREKKIAYCTLSTSRNLNVFFGDENCIKIIQGFGDKKLCDYSPEEDCILGIMLGYDIKQQCIRYLSRKDSKPNLLGEKIA